MPMHRRWLAAALATARCVGALHEVGKSEGGALRGTGAKLSAVAGEAQPPGYAFVQPAVAGVLCVPCVMPTAGVPCCPEAAAASYAVAPQPLIVPVIPMVQVEAAGTTAPPEAARVLHAADLDFVVPEGRAPAATWVPVMPGEFVPNVPEQADAPAVQPVPAEPWPVDTAAFDVPVAPAADDFVEDRVTTIEPAAEIFDVEAPWLQNESVVIEPEPANVTGESLEAAPEEEPANVTGDALEAAPLEANQLPTVNEPGSTFDVPVAPIPDMDAADVVDVEAARALAAPLLWNYTGDVTNLTDPLLASQVQAIADAAAELAPMTPPSELIGGVGKSSVSSFSHCTLCSAQFLVGPGACKALLATGNVVPLTPLGCAECSVRFWDMCQAAAEKAAEKLAARGMQGGGTPIAAL